jgi:hypothetical protein
MNISPCNNCKKKENCEVPKYIIQNSHLGVFELSDQMINMPVLVSIVSMNKREDKVVLECDAVSLVQKPENTYEALVNSKPQDDDCCDIGVVLSERCKKGDCGGCGGH